MTKYISRMVVVEAYQVPYSVATDAAFPRWVANARFHFSTKGAVEYVAINQSTKETRVLPGDWIVNERNVLSRMSDADFQAKFRPLEMSQEQQADLFERTDGPVVVHHTSAEDAPEWLEFDSSKPASTMSVRDRVFMELLKMRMRVWELDTKTLLVDHDEEVDLVLTAMGYD